MVNYTENQKKIINQISGPVLVIACPGSGKTTTMLGRVRHMIETGINPSNILVVTFTKASAEDMTEKYKKIADDAVTFSTIHSLCLGVITQEYDIPYENILTKSKIFKFFEKLLENNYNKKELEMMVGYIISEISACRNTKISPEKYISENFNVNDFCDYFHKYKTWKEEKDYIDYDDMLEKTLFLFQTDKNVLELWQDRFPYIIIDEFQDTNKIQSEIFFLLAEKYRNICVVGDDDQSIYRFRAADPSIMLNFQNTYPDCKRFDLDTNYRSETEVIRVASNLIENNKVRFQKEFKASKKEKGEVIISPFTEFSTQLKDIANEIKELVKDKNIPCEEIAILFRNHKFGISYINLLELLKLPYNVKEQPFNIYKDFMFKDFQAYYRLANGCDISGDVQQVLNHPSRYLKKEYFQNINKFNKNDIYEAVKKVPNSAYLKGRVYNFISDIKSLKTDDPKEFFNALDYMNYAGWAINDYAPFCKRDYRVVKEMYETLKMEACSYKSLNTWLQHGENMITLLENPKKDKTGITLATFHASKGLEWKYVYIVSCDEGVVPSKHAQTDEDIEEERRLLYVAITRAKERVKIYTSNKPSYFLDELKLEEKNKKKDDAEKKNGEKNKKRKAG